MIVSASFRTDLPAFYGAWFMNRLDAGYCLVPNPYSDRHFRVSLAPADADGIVFWTKNLRPFAKHLPEIRDRGFPFVIQYGINGYPKELERSVVDARRSVICASKAAPQPGQRNTRRFWRTGHREQFRAMHMR